MKQKVVKCNCGERPASWRGIPGEDLSREYPGQHWYFCDECFEKCVEGVWSGGGPFGEDFIRFENLKASRWERVTGSLSTLLIFLGAPLAALLVESPAGWILYLLSAILGIVYAKFRRDRIILAQFLFYLFMNTIAIILRF